MHSPVTEFKKNLEAQVKLRNKIRKKNAPFYLSHLKRNTGQVNIQGKYFNMKTIKTPFPRPKWMIKQWNTWSNKAPRHAAFHSVRTSCHVQKRTFPSIISMNTK